jgi:hypothetical protein
MKSEIYQHLSIPIMESMVFKLFQVSFHYLVMLMQNIVL